LIGEFVALRVEIKVSTTRGRISRPANAMAAPNAGTMLRLHSGATARAWDLAGNGGCA